MCTTPRASFHKLNICLAPDPAPMQNDSADRAGCDAMSRDDPVKKAPDILSRRLMTLNFAAIHTSTMTLANMILDIASGSAGERCLTAVFTECRIYGVQQHFPEKSRLYLH